VIDPVEYTDLLKELGVSFYTGVPDSLLKDFYSCVHDNLDSANDLITANEGAAVAYAAGRYLASSQLGVVYLQNSGFGNIINPLTSLIDPEVYKIPMLFLIGWRGQPGVSDEPQHVKQGKVQEEMLKATGIPYDVHPDTMGESAEVLEKAFAHLTKESSPYALLVPKGVFAKYTPEKKLERNFPMKREDALELILGKLGSEVTVVSTTGKTSREVFEIRERNNEGHAQDFLTVGSMGHASHIALGIAHAKPEAQVLCIDGDGAFLMHMGSVPINASLKLKNFKHVVINNGAHESVGGQPTVALEFDLPGVARASGYQEVRSGESSYQSVAARLEPVLGQFEVVRIQGFSANPKVEEVEGLLSKHRLKDYDVLMAVGGGTAMDIAKLLKYYDSSNLGAGGNEGSQIDLAAPGNSIAELPLVAIPTTSGSGSEATHFAVVYKGIEKFSIADSALLPEAVLLDPLALEKLPDAIFASSLLDAFCQSIESYWSIYSTEQSRDFALLAMRILTAILPEVLEERSEENLQKAMDAAHAAGQAINITKTTAPHAVSYPLTANFGASHGFAVACLMPEFLVYNAESTEEEVLDSRGLDFVSSRMKEIYQLFGVSDSSEAKFYFVELLKAMKAPVSLEDMGVRKADFSLILEHGFNPARVNNNPRLLTKSNLEVILAKAWQR